MKPTDFLSKNDIQRFTERSDLAGAWMVLSNWLIIAAAFTTVALWTNPITLLFAILLLGGRQLGLAILMHEAGHKTLFRSQHMNQLIGQWLCAYPVMGDCDRYGASHRVHHRTAGTENDPDLPNYQSYPVSKQRFIRKLKRDLSGQTGFKLLAGLVTGGGRSIMMREGEKTSVTQGLIANSLLFGVLLAFGQPALYLLWLTAYVIAYPLLARIRQVAEHGAVPNLFDADPRRNTRTTLARWYERAVLCPNYVNYHLEHHLLASVPCYRLPALHRHLKAKGFYEGYPDALAYGYWDVIGRAVPELGPIRSAPQ